MMERPFPRAEEAERALLGGLMQDPDQIDSAIDILKADDFYRPEHAALFELLTEMKSRNAGIDMVSVPLAVQKGGEPQRFGGVPYVLQLPDHAPSTANLPHYAELVKEKAVLRTLITTGQDLSQKAWSDPPDVQALLDQASRDILTLGETGQRKSWGRISEIIDTETLRIEQLAESTGTGPAGHTTGFLDLDDKLAGLHPTDLLILAARPAMGKTALALNMAQNVAVMAGVPVGLFSLEMSRGQLVTRMLCCHALVDAGRVRTGDLEPSDWDRLLDSSDLLRQAPVFIDDTPGLTISQLKARARRLKAENPNLGLIVIDYLQLMSGDDPRASREQQISAISRGLKGLAKDLDVPVLALSQLNRSLESRQNKRPRVSDLRESGAIEQDADIILFIYRDEVYNEDSADKGLAEVIIAKQRNGPIGTVKLAFRGQYTRFDNFADDDDLEL